MREIQFEERIVGLAHTFGWKVAGFRPARTNKGWRTAVKYDGKGYPDLTLIHPESRVIVFAEIKAQNGQLSDEQDQWGEWLQAVTNRDRISGPPDRESFHPQVYYFTWYPSYWDEYIVPFITFGRVRPC